MIARGDTPTRPAQDDIAWADHGLTDTLWNLLMDCWKYKPADRPAMPAVLSKLEIEDKVVDSRPAERENGNNGAVMHFRKFQGEQEVKKIKFWEELEYFLRHIVPSSIPLVDII
ncbi:hypothetical protein H0H93_014969 [Arthromyces matolae]|nr:hypothetical protein H0H93_014969 [Arthromyces matolae]